MGSGGGALRCCHPASGEVLREDRGLSYGAPDDDRDKSEVVNASGT